MELYVKTTKMMIAKEIMYLKLLDGVGIPI